MRSLNLPAAAVVYICRGGKPIQGLAVSLERGIISTSDNCLSDYVSSPSEVKEQGVSNAKEASPLKADTPPCTDTLEDCLPGSSGSTANDIDEATPAENSADELRCDVAVEMIEADGQTRLCNDGAQVKSLQNDSLTKSAILRNDSFPVTGSHHVDREAAQDVPPTQTEQEEVVDMSEGKEGAENVQEVVKRKEKVEDVEDEHAVQMVPSQENKFLGIPRQIKNTTRH
ncbi:hypothetical protein WMY93_018068 [Mugilogobius chulae]|uniref:Uncharacterized protein n=1 Tax=Mugilogobius chulae TaxID=88201 RepID=A0AAW0NV34_9GOBI